MPAESALSLVERLRAALDRAEEIARAVTLNDHEPWWNADDLGAHVDEYDSAFIVANGPDVVLRSVAAHRKIIAMCKFMIDSRDADPSNWNPAVSAEHILDDLAAVYFPEEAPDAN